MRASRFTLATILTITAFMAGNTFAAIAQLTPEGPGDSQQLPGSANLNNLYFNSYWNRLKLYSPDLLSEYSIQTKNINSGGSRTIISPAQELHGEAISLRQQHEVLNNKDLSVSSNTLPSKANDPVYITPDYTVYLSGGTYYGRNQTTGSLLSNPSFSSLMSSLNARLYRGGIIFIKSGIYNIDSPISITHSIDIVGAGRGNTILLRTILSSSPTISVSGSNLTISGITVDGNYPRNRSNLFNELLLTGSNILCKDTEVKNFNAKGISAQGAGIRISDCVITGVNAANKSTFGIWAANNLSRTIISGCNIQYTSLNAVFGGNIFTVENSYIANNAIAAGGQIASAPNTVTARVINNVIDPGLGLDSGIEMAPTGKWIVINNRISGQNHWGIVTDGAQIIGPAIVVGNIVKNSKLSAIYINGAQHYFMIEGNTLFDDQQPPTQTYGIQIGKTAANHYTIKDNVCYNNKVAEILDQGTGADKEITGNINYEHAAQSPITVRDSPFT
jgi:hypothetical protein